MAVLLAAKISPFFTCQSPRNTSHPNNDCVCKLKTILVQSGIGTLTDLGIDST